MAKATRGALVDVPLSAEDERWMRAVGYAYRGSDGVLTLTATGIGWTREWLRRERETPAETDEASREQP